jgi:hypothetical protein
MAHTNKQEQLRGFYESELLLGQEGVAWSVQPLLTAVNLCLLDRSRYFSFEELLSYPHGAEWASFQVHHFSEYLAVRRIEPGTSGSVAWHSDH